MCYFSETKVTSLIKDACNFRDFKKCKHGPKTGYVGE